VGHARWWQQAKFRCASRLAAGLASLLTLNDAWASGDGTLPPQDLLQETSRAKLPPPEPGTIRLQLHGEYQVRLTALSDLPLRPHPTRPGTASLRQTERLQHWLRLTPTLQLLGPVQVVGQLDFPTGLIAGRENELVGSADDPLDDRHPLRSDLRWLYAEWLSGVARVRLGQQPSHFGLGIVENDGDHPTPFGDYHGGNRVERAELSLNVLGASSPWRLRVAADLVYRDPFADLTEHETAMRAVLSAHYEPADESFFALYGALRHQRNRNQSLPGAEFDETLDWVTLDSTGRLRTEIPGVPGWAFAEYEVAVRLGNTSIARTVSQEQNDELEQIRAYGGAVRFGAAATSGAGANRFAHVVGSLEWGWASGDADPYDGVYRRFDFNPNHNVGLILFDEVLAWKTARAASLAQAPELVGRPLTGTALLPSNGAIFGATYLHPLVVYRPVRVLDLQLGAVVAQTTADFVDPAGVHLDGDYANYDAGDVHNHDLGLELDAGVEYRILLPYGSAVHLGSQAGILFPGNAFADATGSPLGRQYLAMGRLGVVY